MLKKIMKKFIIIKKNKALYFYLIFIFLLGCSSYFVKKESFIIDKNNGDKAWSKAQSYIAQKSDYRVQIISDYVIDTYFLINDTNPGRVGYTITREHDGVNYNFTIIVRTNDINDSKLAYRLHDIKYYILDKPKDKLISTVTTNKNETEQSDINDLPDDVKKLALKEMSETEINDALKGIPVKTAKKINLDSLKKLKSFDSKN